MSKGTSDGERVTVVASTSSFDKHGQHEIENLPTNILSNLSDRTHQLDKVFKLQSCWICLHLPGSSHTENQLMDFVHVTIIYFNVPVSWLAHGQKMG